MGDALRNLGLKLWVEARLNELRASSSPRGFYNREEALFMWILTFAYVFDRGKRWSTSYNSPENVCNVQTPCGDDLGQLEF